MVVPAARGRGVALRSLELLTRGASTQLGLIRLELRIDPANAPSLRIAERAGYVQEGCCATRTSRTASRGDVAVWSRLTVGLIP